MKGEAKVTALSLFARKSAKASSLKAKLDIKIFKKNDLGIPAASNNVYWSVSHKLDFVAGIVSKQKVGIDIECIKKSKKLSYNLFEKIVDHDEQLVFKGYDKNIAFFRAFTAKEAVLKLTGDGIKGLSEAKIKNIINDKICLFSILIKNILWKIFILIIIWQQ